MPPALITHSQMTTASAENGPTPETNASASEPAETSNELNVEKIKEKYWAQGEESELGVVQNRLYSKERKFEFGAFAGIIGSDPFLNMSCWGGLIGYHFSEYFALNFTGWKHMVSKSSALQFFEDRVGATTNINPPYYYLGGEITANILYGKLSLVGKSIIYYDMHLMAGMGATATESGTYFTPGAGVGQQVYLNQTISLRLDYRLQYYRETIVQKVIPTKMGQVVGQRNNWNNAVTLGFDFLIGGGVGNSNSHTGGAK